MELASVALWLALYLALAFVGLPLAGALFPRLPDRGASVALPLVLVVLFLVTYAVGRVSLAASALAALVVLGALVAVALRRGVDFDTDAYLEMALVFSVAFLFLVAVRAIDPTIVPTGGEKFLDFGLLKAALRAETLPIEDVWFAGEPVMYYFGGHLLVAQLVRITGTAPGVAYNLALAGFFAAYVTAAYGLAGNVAARGGTFERRAALLGAFFVGFASNLFTPLRLLLRPLPVDVAGPIARALGVWRGRTGRGGALITDAEPFHYWDASGVIEGAINEFPLFAFRNGDLHAHMMAPPITLLLATVLYAYVRTPAEHRRRRLALLFGLLPAIGGTLAVVNTWSFPATAGLPFLALLFDDGTRRTLLPSRLRERLATTGPVRREAGRVAVAAVAAGGVAAIAVGWSLPFWLANAAGRELAFLPGRSSLASLAIVHGTFLLPVALYLGYLCWARFDLDRRQLAAVAGLTVVWIAGTAVLDVAVVGIFVPLLLGGYLLGSRVAAGRRRPTPGVDGRAASLPGFELVLLLGAAGLVVVVEFVYLQELAAPERFNTVFKVYAQVWAFFAVGTAVALGRLLQLSDLSQPWPWWPTVLRGFVAVLVVATSVYGGIAIGQHFAGFAESGGDATLDGTAWIDDHPDRSAEAAAIRWLDDRDGTPTIVTSPGGAYTWRGAPSALTGVPTVIGWQHHERGFGRDPADVARRVDDVETIYTGRPAEQRQLLSEYDVEYVYVGPEERDEYGGDVSVGALDVVSPAAEFDAVTIYAVEQTEIDDGS